LPADQRDNTERLSVDRHRGAASETAARSNANEKRLRLVEHESK
jgi:hypothetical protein